MNSIDLLNAIAIQFDNPWLLLLLIPALALMLWPYFRLSKKHRRTRNRVISLVLHSLILLLCTLMVAGMTFHVTDVEIKSDVILLVDKSDSSTGRREDMDEFIRSVLGGSTSDYRIGIVTFANGCVYSAELGKDVESVYNAYETNNEFLVGNATDIAAALQYARDRLSNPKEGRIILLSDGIQTDGNALATVKAIADGGTRVDTVYFSALAGGDEVLISSVDVPQRAHLGDTINVNVITQSTAAGNAILTLYEKGEAVSEQEVRLSGGEDAFLFEYTVLLPNLHEFSVTIQSDSDTLPQNNTYYAYINIVTASKILLVDGTGKESDVLYPLLDENYEVTRVGLSELPNTFEALCRYDEVILMNVSNEAMPDGFDLLLTDYVEFYGGGLYTIGGDQAYLESDMHDTFYERLLPVEANTDAKTLGLLLVIDCSGSMENKAGNTGLSRIELAKQAAVASLNQLGPDDYVGIVAFNNEVTKTMPMTSATRKDYIENFIYSLETKTGTRYLSAINAVVSMLYPFDETDLRHVIFLTDGEPVDNANDIQTAMYYINALANQNITLSTIALGPSVALDTVQKMAQLGNGECYSVTQEGELIRVMVEETVRAAGEHTNVKEFVPSIMNRTPAVAGIQELPQMNGFYGARIKPEATTILAYDGNPIYAEWSYGLGRVGSLMCDLNGTWSSLYFIEESGINFILNTVNMLFLKESGEGFKEIEAEFVHDNFTTQARITASMEEGDTLTAQLISPDGKTETVLLNRLTSSSYVTEFASDVQGVYTLRITKTGRNGTTEVNTYTTFSYSDEYASFPDETESFTFMESLSENGNGRMLYSAENLFGSRNESVEYFRNPALAFLITCAVLFLLDIVVRKFKIKWIHEILEDRKQKKEGAR